MKTITFQHCFHIEREIARGAQPRVVFTGWIEGASQRAEVRLPPPLRERLQQYAPNCRTTAVVALAHQGLLQLINDEQRLVSNWIPDAKGGHFHHMPVPEERGMPRVDCGALPRQSKAEGRTPNVAVSIPDALLRALRTEARHVSTGLAALADWQLTMLINGKQRIVVTPQ